MTTETIIFHFVVAAQLLAIGFMVGEINAMRRADRHRETLRRIRLGLE